MKKAVVVVVDLLCTFNGSFANVIINNTRVIYPSNSTAVTVDMANEGDVPSLVQSWIDEGNDKETPSTTKAPFFITPPITRVEPHQGQQLRIVFSGQKPLSDKQETLFFLNVLDIPAKSKDKNTPLSFALKNRLKLFYRPSNLPRPTEADFNKLVFRVKNNTLTVNNDTSHYMTLSGTNQPCGNDLIQDSIAPFSTVNVCHLKAKSSVKEDFVFTLINDFGGESQIKAKLIHN